jgi:hypothetical protein
MEDKLLHVRPVQGLPDRFDSLVHERDQVRVLTG